MFDKEIHEITLIKISDTFFGTVVSKMYKYHLILAYIINNPNQKNSIRQKIKLHFDVTVQTGLLLANKCIAFSGLK